MTRGIGFARGRQAVSLARAGRAFAAYCASQGIFHAFGQCCKMRFAVERRENGAAHQGRAAQAGQDRSGKPLGRDAAAIDGDAGAPID